MISLHVIIFQYKGIGWIPRETVPSGQTGGFTKMGGEVGKTIVHPSTSQWNLPKPTLDRIRKADPMEYLNLLNPTYTIS